jgi:WD40 repeat protein
MFRQFKIEPTLTLGGYVGKSERIGAARPLKGTLITEIYEHRDTVTCLENIADEFLVSAGNDGTVRVFSVPKIEASIVCESEGAHEIKRQGQ